MRSCSLKTPSLVHSTEGDPTQRWWMEYSGDQEKRGRGWGRNERNTKMVENFAPKCTHLFWVEGKFSLLASC